MAFENAVSVIIPVHNRLQLLVRALDSVRAQMLAPLEIIVVDDGSDEDLTPVLQDWPDVRLVRQPHAGVSRARNHGVGVSSGDWIAFLDSDDQWLPEKLQRQAQALDESGLLLCHTNEIWIRNGVRVNPHNKHRKYGGDIFKRCLPLCVISPSSVILAKSLFEAEGGFDETLPACEDYDLWLRITCRHQVEYLETPLTVKHGGHADQLSMKYWGMDRFRIQALENLYAHGQLAPAQADWVVNELILKCEIFALGALKRGQAESHRKYRQKLEYYQNLAIDKHIKKS